MVGWVVRALCWPLAPGRQGTSQAMGAVDAIVVLGAPVGPTLEERVRAGVALWQQGVAPRMILSGIAPEAPTMARMASQLGVPEAALWIEDRARSTQENALRSAELLRAAGLRSALVVTTPYHLRRAMALFRRAGIDAYDAVQVRVDFANGMSINFHNNWITPADFEGPVNQGHEIVGTEGKVESDQQYRGLRWWSRGGGSRTANTHFTRAVARPDGSLAAVGYGVDSLIAALASICRVKFFGATRQSVAHLYPTAEEARTTVAIVHAARLVRDLNFKYLKAGKGATVTARFGKDGITIVDPNRGRGKVFQRLYERPI